MARRILISEKEMAEILFETSDSNSLVLPRKKTYHEETIIDDNQILEIIYDKQHQVFALSSKDESPTGNDVPSTTFSAIQLHRNEKRPHSPKKKKRMKKLLNPVSQKPPTETQDNDISVISKLLDLLILSAISLIPSTTTTSTVSREDAAATVIQTVWKKKLKKKSSRRKRRVIIRRKVLRPSNQNHNSICNVTFRGEPITPISFTKFRAESKYDDDDSDNSSSSTEEEDKDIISCGKFLNSPYVLPKPVLQGNNTSIISDLMCCCYNDDDHNDDDHKPTKRHNNKFYKK